MTDEGIEALRQGHWLCFPTGTTCGADKGDLHAADCLIAPLFGEECDE